jgi:hypothetical protein
MSRANLEESPQVEPSILEDTKHDHDALPDAEMNVLTTKK